MGGATQFKVDARYLMQQAFIEHLPCAHPCALTHAGCSGQGWRRAGRQEDKRGTTPGDLREGGSGIMSVESRAS